MLTSFAWVGLREFAWDSAPRRRHGGFRGLLGGGEAGMRWVVGGWWGGREATSSCTSALSWATSSSAAAANFSALRRRTRNARVLASADAAPAPTLLPRTTKTSC